MQPKMAGFDGLEGCSGCGIEDQACRVPGRGLGLGGGGGLEPGTQCLSYNCTSKGSELFQVSSGCLYSDPVTGEGKLTTPVYGCLNRGGFRSSVKNVCIPYRFEKLEVLSLLSYFKNSRTSPKHFPVNYLLVFTGGSLHEQTPRRLHPGDVCCVNLLELNCRTALLKTCCRPLEPGLWSQTPPTSDSQLCHQLRLKAKSLKFCLFPPVNWREYKFLSHRLTGESSERIHRKGSE